MRHWAGPIGPRSQGRRKGEKTENGGAVEQMAAELVFSTPQSSLLLQPSRFRPLACVTPLRSIRLQRSSSSDSGYQRSVVSSPNQKQHFQAVVSARVVASDSQSSSIITDNVDLATEGIEVVPDTGGGSDGDIGGRGEGGGGGGGGGGGDNSGDGDRKGEGESSDDSGEKKKMDLSMSQKLTLGYAGLVAMGGLMGYLKSGSQKSVLAGGLSASVLYYVHTQLPTNPVYASSIGLGVSAALLGVMGSRFLKSKKIFPAGLVSLLSFIMTGGYLHGIMRGMH